jgi:hypothetical protein
VAVAALALGGAATEAVLTFVCSGPDCLYRGTDFQTEAEAVPFAGRPVVWVRPANHVYIVRAIRRTAAATTMPIWAKIKGAAMQPPAGKWISSSYQ